MEHTKQQILPDDILVEIAEYDWRVYNAIVRCNKALNKRLQCARYRTQGALGNYIKHVQWRQDATTIDPNEIARYYRYVVIDEVIGYAHVYKNGVLTRSLTYDLYDNYLQFDKLERYCSHKTNNVRYEECVAWDNGEVESISRYRKHPRGYRMYDTYIAHSCVMRFDDYYLAKHTSTLRVDASSATWRICDDFFVYNYAK